MDDIIRFLGENYHHIDRWGIPIIFIAVVTAFVIVLFADPFRRRILNWLTKIVLIVSLFPVVAAVLFVKSKVNSLNVPSGYQLQQVVFKNQTVELSGELLLPEQGGPHPAVVFICGSDVSSYHTNYSRLVNEVMTPILSARHFAILYYDKRGVGPSTGDWKSSNFAVLAADAHAGIDYLRTRREINKGRVLVIGHSQGGWIAPLAASSYPDIFASASLAGPATSVEDQIFDDEFNSHLCMGEDSISAHNYASNLIAELNKFSEEATSGRYLHYALTHSYDPKPAITSLKQPALFMFGENDRLVPAQKNIGLLRSFFNDSLPAQLTIKLIAGVNHSFRVAEFCHRGSQSTLRYAEEFGNALGTWLDALPR